MTIWEGGGCVADFLYMEEKKETLALAENEREDVINLGIRLIQNTSGLLFGTDAYLLAAFMRRQPNAKACEFGAGTGVISLLAAKAGKFKTGLCVEVQESFAALCNRNIENNDLSDRLEVLCSDVRDLGKGDSAGAFDVVFTNPPYMKADSGKRNEKDEKYIARHEVCGGIEDFVIAASKCLRFGGLFYAVMRPDRLADILIYMRSHAIEPKRICFVHSDTESEPSVCLIEGMRGGKPSLKVEKPLFLSKLAEEGESAQMTERAQKIYQTLSFE